MPKKPGPEDYLLLMFAMKKEGKHVGLAHCQEKLKRDVGKVSKPEVKRLLDRMAERGWVRTGGKRYARTEKGVRELEKRLPGLEKSKFNFTYLTVYTAKKYYPKVAETILEFCRGRHVGFYVLFTGQRFFRRNFRSKVITIRSLEDIMRFADLHYIDVIPCVHRIGKERPDWLVTDLDAGPKVRWPDIRKATRVTYRVMEGLGLNPVIKFSGKRGFQVWSLLDLPVPKWWEPIPLYGGTERVRDNFSLYVDVIRLIQSKVDRKLPGLTVGEILPKKQREDRILLDHSSMKHQGLVRAPFGLHSSTGLVSLPVSLKEVDSFRPETATPERAAREYQKRRKLFEMEKARTGRVLKELKGFSDARTR